MRIFFIVYLFSLLTSCVASNQDRTNVETQGESIENGQPEKNVLFAEKNNRLLTILINEPPVNYCEREHHHFVDIKAKGSIDSLINENVTEILFYRHWIGTNGFNGYGKLVWQQNGKFYQYQFNFENYDGRYGISSIDKTEHQSCDAINFYQNARIDTVETSPREPEMWISHAADHFVYTYFEGVENCFNVSGSNLAEDSTHVKSQLINKLKIPSRDYFEMLEKRRS